MRRTRLAGAAAGGLLAALALAVTPGSGAPAVAPPDVFSVRVEGFAVETTQQTTSTQTAPRTGYSFAKINSTPSLDGGRDLDLEARGASRQYNGFEGVVIFTVDNGARVPGYSVAFFPTFEGFSTVSEKCAANQTEYKETPECRDQPGEYAYAQVFPEQDAPRSTSIGRSSGNAQGGSVESRSDIVPTAEGVITSVQRNSGSNQGVPGTPIVVDSFLAESRIEAKPGSVKPTATCSGKVSLAGQEIVSDAQLQQVLGSIPASAGLDVKFLPPTEAAITHLPGGGAEVRCRGPRFEVFNALQGGTGVTYTFGNTYSAAGPPESRGTSSTTTTPSGGFFPTPPTSPSQAPSSGQVPPVISAGGDTGSSGEPAGPTTTPTTTAGQGTTGSETLPESELAGNLIERRVESMPVGAWAFVAGTLLALGVWLLFGVTGSLARGMQTLKLPPFTD